MLPRAVALNLLFRILMAELIPILASFSSELTYAMVPCVTLKLGYELSYEPAPGSPSVKAALNQTLKVLVCEMLG